MKRRMKTKLVVALMFILTLGLALGVGAYWAGVVNAPADVEDTVEVTIGEAQEVVTTLVVGDTHDGENKVLVPSGRASVSTVPAGKTVTEIITYTFSVTWEETNAQATGTLGDLSVAVSNISNSLLNVVVTPDSAEITLGGPAVVVTVELTLTEPATQAEYNAVINQVLTFDITFTVALQ